MLDTYQDEYGFIGHFDPRLNALEFGDCWQRVGTYAASDKDNAQSIAQGLCEMTDIEGEYVRHIDGSMWYGRPGTMSRDNFQPMVLFNKNREFLKTSLIRIIKRGGFLWNKKEIWSDKDKAIPIPDWCGFGTLAGYIRSFGAWWLYPLLMVLDVELLLNSLIRVFMSVFRPDDTSDDLNLTLRLLKAYETWDTPCSFLAGYWYFNMRRKPTRVFEGIFTNCPVQMSWDSYYRSEHAPPMNDVMRDKISLLRSVYGV